MILVRWTFWIALALAIMAVERRFGHRDRGRHDERAALTDQVMSLATAAALAGGLAGSLAFPLPTVGPGWMSLGLGIGVGGVGVGLRAVSMHRLGPAYTLTPGIQAGQSLIVSGAYRWVRHPGYAGILLSLLGLQLILGTWVAVLSMAFVILPLPVRIRLEEAMLARHFGAAYADYCRRTPYRLVPGLV